MICCETRDEQISWWREINMVHSYLLYDSFIQDKKRKDFPFFLDWVSGWETHCGYLEIKDSELLTEGNEVSMEEFIKNNEAVSSFGVVGIAIDDDMSIKIGRILSNFNNHQIMRILLRGNSLTGESLSKFADDIAHQEFLEKLEIIYNQLNSTSLQLFSRIFSSTPSLEILNLQHNMITKQGLGKFLREINRELQLKQLDLSYNLIDDTSIKTIIKRLIRNEKSSIELLNIAGNKFTGEGFRTLHKAHRLSQKTLKDEKHLNIILGPIQYSNIILKELIKGEHSNNWEIARKPLNGGTKDIPIKREWIGLIGYRELEIKETMKIGDQKGSGPVLEEIKDLLTKIEGLPFEFPMAKLAEVYDYVESALQKAAQSENIYCLEILMSCGKSLGMENLRFADERLAYLKKFGEKVVEDLAKVLNMEFQDEILMNETLDKALKDAEKLGLRGDLIDTCLYLQSTRNKFVEDMQTKSLEDSDDDKISVKNEEINKVDDVFDPKYDKFIEQTLNQLKLNLDEDQNLAFHPLRADYIAISQLRPERVRQNLKVAVEVLRHEESYAHANISNRAQFLLCSSYNEHAWGLSKNDFLLRITRILFRYRNNLDGIMEYVKPFEIIKPLTTQY